MVGRRQSQKRDRQQRIMQAARTLFATRGYAETGMQEIAATADLAVGTLYNYFRSKPDLLVAIVRGEVGDLLAAGELILARRSRSPLEAAGGLIDAYVQALGTHPRKLWCELVCAALSDPDTIGARVFELDLRMIGQIAAFLERLRERGVLVPGVDCGRLAIALYAIYFTWSNAYFVNDTMSLDDLRKEIRYGVRAVLGGMLASDGRVTARPRAGRMGRSRSRRART